MYELWSARGSGGVIIEAMLTLADAPVRIIDAPPWEDGPHLEELRQVNPLVQVPVLVLEDGTVMTESGAIALLLHERHPSLNLMPPAGDPLRPAFLRWLFFLTASIYATFRYEDHADQLVSGAESQAELREHVSGLRKAMLRQLDAAAGTPYFLGDRVSVLDLYITAMSYWWPRRNWFAENCARLDAIAGCVEDDPRLAPIFARHFG